MAREKTEEELQIEKGIGLTPDQMKEIEAGEFLTVSEIANKLNYSYQWVLWNLQCGRIKGVKPLGRRWRIPRSEFDKILKVGLPALPKKEVEKRPPTEIRVDKKTEDKIREPTTVERKKPSSLWGLDFSGLFGGKK